MRILNTRHTRRPSPARRGFSLPELLVSIMMLTIGVAALTSTSATVSQMIGGAAQEERVSSIAISRFERLRSTPCASIAGGTASSIGVDEKWTVTAQGTHAFFVTDTVRFNRLSRKRAAQAFRTVVSC